jgi:hypothetical protein
MCLRIFSNREALIADNDIECYKIVVKNKKVFSKKYFTLARLVNIKLGDEYTSDIEFDTITKFFPRTGRSVTKITIEKGLHSFTNLRDAKSFCQTQLLDESYNYYIVKCIIPKNSKYYIGIFENKECYASNNIKYTTEIVYNHTKEKKRINKILEEILNR